MLFPFLLPPGHTNIRPHLSHNGEDPPAVPDSMETQNVLCLVPAIVYDRRGFRVGYGGGYYDRFFGVFKPASIGVAYEEFIVKSVPHGKYDISVDVVASERGIYAGK